MKDDLKHIINAINELGKIFFEDPLNTNVSAQQRSKTIRKIFQYAERLSPTDQRDNLPLDPNNSLTDDGRFALALLLNTWERRRRFIVPDDNEVLTDQTAIRMGRYLNNNHANNIFKGLKAVADKQQSEKQANIQVILAQNDINNRLIAFANSLEWAFSDYMPFKQKVIYHGTQAFALVNVLSETLAVFALGFTALSISTFSLPLAIALPILAIFLYYNAKSNWIVFKANTPEVALDLIARDTFHKGITVSLEDGKVKKMDTKSQWISAGSLIFTFTSAGILAVTAYFGIATELGNNLPEFLKFLGPGLGPIAIIAAIAIFIGIGLLFYKDWSRVAQKRGDFFKEAWRKVFKPDYQKIKSFYLTPDDVQKAHQGGRRPEDPLDKMKTAGISAEALLAAGYKENHLRAAEYTVDDIQSAKRKKILKISVLSILTLLVLAGMAISAYMGTISLESLGVPALPAILLGGGLNVIASGMFIFSGTMSATAKISENLYKNFSEPKELAKSLGSALLSILKLGVFFTIAYFTFTGLGTVNIPMLASIAIAMGAGVVGYQVVNWVSNQLFAKTKASNKQTIDNSPTATPTTFVEEGELENQYNADTTTPRLEATLPIPKEEISRDLPRIIVGALSLEDAALNAGSNAIKNLVVAVAVAGPIFSGFLLMGRAGSSFASMYGAGDNLLTYGDFTVAEITKSTELKFGEIEPTKNNSTDQSQLLNTYGLFKLPRLNIPEPTPEETLVPPNEVQTKDAAKEQV